MAKSKDKTSHPKKGLDKKALIEGIYIYWSPRFNMPLQPSMLPTHRSR